MAPQSHKCLKKMMVKSQSVCYCNMQNLELKFVLKDIEGMQQSMQRIFMEKKTTKKRYEATWVNRQKTEKER